MKPLFSLLAAGLAVIASSPAFAQDDPQASTTPAAGFSGIHVDATFGWDHLTTRSLKDTDPAAEFKNSGDGVTFGGGIGYDLPVTDRVTLGAELGLYGSTAKWTNPNLVAGTFNTVTARAGRDLYVGAKIGYVLSPKTELFATAGYTNTRFALTGSDGTETLYDGINANGVRVGAGIEHTLTKATYVKLAYDFSHYGTGPFNYAGSTPDASTFDLHSDRHRVLAGVGVRF